jgi:succinate-semialdehyde dehydrogenase/glutarate-semialdehyde dehydrogenase
MIIDGKKVNSSTGEEIKVLNPATGDLIDTVPAASQDDIEKALDVAQEGKKEWRDTPLHKRCSILQTFTSKVEEDKEDLARLVCQETGKPINQSRGEIGRLINLFNGFAEKAKHLYGETMPDIYAGLEKDLLFTRREPLGVIACIIPFNFPVVLFAHKVSPALTMGNSVIVKPSSDNPLTEVKLVELLLESGVPGNVVQVVTGSGAKVGRWLSSSSKINAITLTGSTVVGIDIYKNAAANLSRVFLELGGNGAFVVLDDANLELAVKEAKEGRTANAGQICSSPKRFIIHNSIKEAFTEQLISQLEGLKIGNPEDPDTDVGCLISEKAAITVEQQVEKTIEQGAKCIYGGKRFNKSFFQPTVLTDVTPDMDVAQDMEIFGPVFPIIGFDTIEEAIEIANNTQYGLMTGVITQNINRGLQVAEKLESGGVIINGSGRYRNPDMAYGGYKKSGIGREGISVTLEEMSQIKNYVLKNIF